MSDIKLHRYLKDDETPTGLWAAHQGDPSEPLKVLTDGEVEDLIRSVIHQFGNVFVLVAEARKAKALDWLEENHDVVRIEHSKGEWTLYDEYRPGKPVTGDSLLEVIESAKRQSVVSIGGNYRPLRPGEMESAK